MNVCVWCIGRLHVCAVLLRVKDPSFGVLPTKYRSRSDLLQALLWEPQQFTDRSTILDPGDYMVQASGC